ncbi:MAG: alpha-L-fucosidase [Bacteroidaceae bacterium]|nr:alpha-L-fucosidase [Bacteroidaceae bacterium]
MRNIIAAVAAGLCTLAPAALWARADEPVEQGPFAPTWESLEQWECPEWFRDAKFGIWAHWGPQCQAEAGDWYARGMYLADNWQHKYHVEHYGSPALFGMKDLCHAWKAERWEPEALVRLYKSVGAQFFFTLGQHHDNFDLWDSPYQEWNSVRVGPQRDIVGEWAAACKKLGLPLGVSIHGAHAWTWFEPAQAYDGNLTKADGYTPNADGTEKWWRGLDPQELYAQAHERSAGWEDGGSIHRQWDWQNGASQPSQAYKVKLQNRVLQLINAYDPQMLYFDDTVFPFWGCDDSVGLNILAHFYNHSANRHGGRQQVVAMGKVLGEKHKRVLMWDVERGVPDSIQALPWQTCTCIGAWHYDRGIYERNDYKSAARVAHMLVDVVSKNGCLLLSIPMRGEGTIDEREVAMLGELKAWMDVNGESIFGTRPWTTFGEGPLAEKSNPLSAQGFNENIGYSAADIRFNAKGNTVYATLLGWPDAAAATIKSFATGSPHMKGAKVAAVKLLGLGTLAYTVDADGLHVALPATHPGGDIAPVLAVELAPGS